MAVSTSAEMRRRFNVWASAYGGEQLARNGYAIIEKVTCALETPAANDDGEASEIESIVQAMEETGRWKEARVLRIHFFMALLPESEKISMLKRRGLPLSRASYYIFLDAARAYVEGALSQR